MSGVTAFRLQCVLGRFLEYPQRFARKFSGEALRFEMIFASEQERTPSS